MRERETLVSQQVEVTLPITSNKKTQNHSTKDVKRYLICVRKTMNEQDSKPIPVGGGGRRGGLRDGRIIDGGENTYQVGGAGRGGSHHQEESKSNYDGFQERKEDANRNADKKEEVDDDDEESRRDRMLLIRILPFPVRLHRMLMDMEQSGKQHIVSWSSCGRMCCVHNQELFVQEIIPMYFNMSKYRSFTRQLLNYGFQRIGK